MPTDPQNRRFLVAAIVLAGLGSTTRTPGAEPDRPTHLREFAPTIRPILATRCFECHGPDEQEGGVNFATVKDDDHDLQRKRTLWKRAAARVASGEMPPPDDDADPLPNAERDRLLNWLRTAADHVDCTDPTRRDPGPAPLRRLTVVEYDSTIRDLFGLYFSPTQEVGLTEGDSGGNGDAFDNLAATLSLSPASIDKYFAAADKVIDRIFAPDGQGNNARNRLLIVRPGPKLDASDAARQVVTRLARNAYRRPPRPEDVTRLMGFYDRAVAKGATFDEAIRAVLKPVLVSPRFLFRVEEDRSSPDGRPGVAIDDHELAVRLSYFLWSTLPDEELFRLADQEKLSDPTVFPVQIQRMLADRKARALTDHFAAQWLQLRKLNNARPTTEFFPTFNGPLKQAMRDEILTFFDKLRIENRSLLDLLDADYTYVNEPLAAHYGLEGVKGPEMRKVSLDPGQHRGGLLGMAGVLTLTSHTFRTSPTLRGKYVLDVIFGTPPPPPPPNVGQIKDDKPGASKKQATSFREQLAQHATQPTCAGCHRKIDPLGFALDHYNAIGAWRESTAEVPLDVKGVLPTGESIEGASALKQIVLKRKDEFLRNVVEKMMVYALGRNLDYFDECSIRDVVGALSEDENKFSALVQGIAGSTPFRTRRVSNTAH